MRAAGIERGDRSMVFRLTRVLLALGVSIPLALVLGTGQARAASPGDNINTDVVWPHTFIVSGPSGTIDDNTPTFEFSSDDPDATYECRVVDETPFETCTSPYTTAELANGEHTFDVRATDAAGNTDPSGASRTFTVNIDTVLPHTLITSGPSGTIDDNTPTFEFDSLSPGATFECRVDDIPFETCTSPHTTAALANGEHTFEVRAVTAAGNTDPTPASRTFTVNIDTTPPQTQIDSGPPDDSTTNDNDPAFTYSGDPAEDADRFECSLDGVDFAECADAGQSYTDLDDGSHTFAVRAIDAAGNTDPTPASKTWTIDTVAPQTTITSGPSGLNLSRKATFAFTSSEAGSSQCRIDGGDWQACTSPRTYSGVGLGNHTFAVRAIDWAGNVDPTSAQRTWFTLGLLPF